MRIGDFKLNRKDIKTIGIGLTRPECVWVDDDGVFVSDARGGIAHLNQEGEPILIGSGIGEPNGFSRRPDGSFVVAGLADHILYSIEPDGRTEAILDTVGSDKLGPINCATAEGPDRIWISVMTRHASWPDALIAQARDGYVARVENGRAEIVADGLYLTNEIKVSPDGRFLYVAESGAKRISRFEIKPNGNLGARETFGPENFGHGAILDGFSFDRLGNIWVTVIMRNNITVLDPDGAPHVVYEDAKPEALDAFVSAMETGTATPEHMMACMSDGPINLPTSFAFLEDNHESKVLVGSLVSPFLAQFDFPLLSK